MRSLAAIWKRIPVWVPYVWLLVLFFIPFVLVAKVSLSEPAIAIPPYGPTFSLVDSFSALWTKFSKFSFENYVFVTQDSLYWKSYVSSLWIAFNRVSGCLELEIDHQ